MDRKIHAREVGRQIVVTLNLDWQAEGYTPKLRARKLPSGTAVDLLLSAITGEPLQGYHSTDRASFPTPGTYRIQAVGFKSDFAEPDLLSDEMDIEVLK